MPGRSSFRRLAEELAIRWRALQHPAKRRPQALRREVKFWRRWLATGGLEWPEEYIYRFDPNANVRDPVLCRLLAVLPGRTVDILDVGAGPTSMVGHRFPGKRIALTAVDPLAGEYDDLLREGGINSASAYDTRERGRVARAIRAQCLRYRLFSQCARPQRRADPDH